MSGSNTPGAPWNDQLMSALMSPGVNALAGFAGGMAQAAMPSRMPVPFGAALGFGAQGALQGAGQSQQMQQAQQQIQAQRLQNQFQQAMMPAKLSLLGSLTGSGASGSGGGSAPFGAPQISGGDGNSSTGGGAPSVTTPSAAGSGSQYLQDPRTTLAMARFALASGDDRAASALLSSIGTEAGGAGYAMGANGTAFPVPGGAKAPDVIAANAYADAAGSGAGGLPAKLTAQQSQAALDRGTNTQRAQVNASYGAPVAFTGPGPDGTKQNYTIPASLYYAPGGMGAPGGSSDASPSSSTASGSSSGGTIPAALFAQRQQSLENPGGNPAALNGSGPNGTPTSSAAGNGQFTEGTWLPLFKQAFPQQAGQYSDQQILALRGDPTWTSALTVALGKQNAPLLSAAGVQPTAQSLSLAHTLGPQGAVAVMRADPSTPLSQLLTPQQIAANPTFANQTAGGFRNTVGFRMGFAPVDFGGGGQPQSSNAAGIPGAIPGAIVMTPEQTAASQAYGDQSKSIIDAGAKAPQELQKLDVLNGAAQGFRPGATGAMRLSAQRSMVDGLQSLGITPPSWMTSGTAAGETIGKEGMQLAVDLTRSLGSREAMGVLTMIRNVMPNVELSQGGYGVIMSGIKQGVMRDQDLANFRESWMSDPTHSGSWEGGEAAFDKAYPPEAYASRVVALPPPKTQDGAIPNVIYQTPKGPMLWTGTGFVPAQQQTALSQ